jgi:uncharacterized membrane protein YidH (DUF202 family)
MKMFVKSYAFPIAIFVMGVVAVIASNLEITERNQDLELILGGVLICVGFLLWAVPELDRYLKRKDRIRQRSGRQNPAEVARPQMRGRR